MEIDRSLAAFIDISDEPSPLDVVDRSTLEWFATCPAMAVNLLRGRVNNNSMLSAGGEEVHKAFSAATESYIRSGGMAVPGEIADEMAAALRGSRPDVQPAVLDSARFTTYAWAKFLAGSRDHIGIHPENILRYDGGEGERSGQLSMDLESLNLRVTSELDFLASGPSPKVLDEIDYKSGWKHYYIADIASRFQFQLHAVLVFKNYPEVDALSLRVWEPRRGGAGFPVIFPRSKMREYETRIATAAGFYWQYRDAEPADAPIWPADEKCPICPARALCPAVGLPVAALAENPQSFIRELYALEEKADAMRTAAYQHVKATGEDIVTDDGICFGRSKPRKETKANFTLYSTQKKDTPDGQSAAQVETV